MKELHLVIGIYSSGNVSIFVTLLADINRLLAFN